MPTVLRDRVLRVRIFGKGKIHDEVVDGKRFITTSKTWDTFTLSIPRKGSCRHRIGHALVDDRDTAIPATQIRDYDFAAVCDRVGRELAPRTG